MYFNCYFKVDDVVSENKDGLQVNLDHIYGGFDPKVLLNIKDLVSIDISGCCHHDTYVFIECVLKCLKIVKIEMIGCKQFSEHQIVDICTGFPNLKFFDASGCIGISFVSGNTILCNCHNLRVFRVVPKYKEYDKKQWSKLCSTFLDVEFGDDIKKMLSN